MGLRTDQRIVPVRYGRMTPALLACAPCRQYGARALHDQDAAATAPLWQPDAARIAGSQLMRFARFLQARSLGPSLDGDPQRDYAALHRWSVASRARFWSAFADFCGLIADRGTQVLQFPDALPGARWFDDTRVNFAENLLVGDADEVVLVACDEARHRTQLTRGELRRRVASLARVFESRGLGAGDVIAGFLPNGPDAVIAMLATTSLGAVWTSTSPDFGADGVVDRFGQAGARALVAVGGYDYAGRHHDCRATLERVPGIDLLVLAGPDADNPPGAPGRSVERLRLSDVLAADAGAAPPYRRMPFNAPLVILYSSGTTGKPKAIVHGIGGTLLQHRKEHLLHVDVKPGDALFFFTTCGWMMWNWLVSGLASGARVVLFDGAPMYPGPEALWQLAERERVAFFGTSPRYLAALARSGHVPRDRYDLAALRGVLSTGSPLDPAQFQFVHRHIKADVHLASISGGTDILSCFCLGVPWLPVYAGEIQAPGLAMAVEVLDAQGRRVVGEQGELTCAAPFPSAPLGFVDDPEGRRYRRAYFERYPGHWHHGDYAVQTSRGSFVILGRSDAVLNPGGVRIGTAEIYRQVEKLPEVLESLAIGQRMGDAGIDERVVLFVRLAPGLALDAGLESRIRQVIRDNTTPRHVPARIVQAPDLPRTLSGKLVELAVRNVVHGLPVENVDALANPESLAWFAGLATLRD
jgi:acetoacetyl-CoA synthetase